MDKLIAQRLVDRSNNDLWCGTRELDGKKYLVAQERQDHISYVDIAEGTVTLLDHYKQYVELEKISPIKIDSTWVDDIIELDI